MIYGSEAFQKLITDYEFSTVLDIGSGSGEASIEFLNLGKKVTMVDILPQAEKTKHKNCIYRQRFFKDVRFNDTFGCVWCCQVLEHQLNVNKFLTKVFQCLKENGILCITVPPGKNEIVGGHVTIWNAGLLLYNLILAGFDCSNAIFKKYGYNISVILEKKEARLPNNLSFDKGDIEKLSEFFPSFVNGNFDGNLSDWNWDV